MIILIRRHIELIKLLIQENEYKPASFFSEILHVSTKTLYSDMDELIQVAKKFGLDLVKIPRSGILLKGTEQQKDQLMDYIQNDIQGDEYSKEYRRLQIVKRLLILEDKISIEKLSHEFLVSKTSLYNDLVIIEKTMDDPSVKLLSSHDGIEIVGKESNIQRVIERLIISFHIETQIGMEDVIQIFFNKEIVNVVDRLLFEDYLDLTEYVSDYYLRGLRLDMMIFLSRIKLNHHLEKEETFLFNSLKYMETFIVANSMVEKIKYALHIQLTNEDVEYFSQQLFAHRITSKIKTSDPEYESTVKQLLERMTEMEKIDFINDEKLYKSLLYHIPAMIIRLKKGVQIKNPLLADIKSQYTKLFTVVWYALSFIESEYELSLNDDEVSLILIYFQLSLEKLSKTKNIIIVCPYGTSSSQLILNKVKQFLPSRDHIEVATVAKIEQSDLSNVDMIITPVDISTNNVLCVKVNPLISDEDLTRIMQAYTTQLLCYDSHKTREEINMPVTTRYVDIKFVKLHKTYSSKDECLNSMISELEKYGYVTDQFRKSIFNREKMGSTSLDTGVALPHADPDTVKKPVISITTLNKPIKWGDVSVSLIIMVSLSEEEIDTFSSVISELYQLIGNKEHVHRIVELDSIENMIQIFR